MLVFLGWAWMRSVGYRDVLTFYFASAGHELTLAGRRGAFSVTWNELPISGVTWPVFTTSHRPIVGGQWFASAAEMCDGTWEQVPFWLILLLFLVVWLGVLFWRVRRGKGIAR